jgi:hypothetical protein
VHSPILSGISPDNCWFPDRISWLRFCKLPTWEGRGPVFLKEWQELCLSIKEVVKEFFMYKLKKNSCKKDQAQSS